MADPVSIKDVCVGEREDVRKRREKAGLSAEDVSEDLVGLALSGGALRSASFSLGVAQAFQRIGLWRYVDYLSTVSGGGYIGSFLTSSTLKSKKSVSKYHQPLNEPKSDKQKLRVLRFIYGGHYLLRPWRLANTYLIGLVGINLAIVSGLTAICALIAFLWRCLDYPFISDRAAMLIPESDYHRAFWPFDFFFIAWLVSWSISLFRRGGDARGDVARHLLIATVASFLVGVALLFGNGDIAGWENVVTGQNVSFGGRVWGPIVALVLGGLLPFLSPKRLLKSGLNPEKEWERYVFALASTALLVGLPLVIVGWLARENISGFNNDAYRPVVRGDIDDWPALCALLTEEEANRVSSPWPSLSDLASHIPIPEKEQIKLRSIYETVKKGDPRLKDLKRYATVLRDLLNALSPEETSARVSEWKQALDDAGHCIYDKQNPAASGWIFSRGERLSAYEFTRIDRSPSLVFSNACESGITPARSDERAVELAPSFAESFFARGVTNFVCTAWPVDDRAARVFAITLYASLLGLAPSDEDGARGSVNGFRPSEPRPMYQAMQAARLKAADPANDVRTWGAYQHYGNPYFRLFDPAAMAVEIHGPSSISDADDHMENVSGADGRARLRPR